MIDEIRNYIKNKASIDELKSLYEMHSNKFIQEYKDNCIEMFNKIKSI